MQTTQILPLAKLILVAFVTVLARIGWQGRIMNALPRVALLRIALVLLLGLVGLTKSEGGTWTPLTNSPPGGPNLMLLLSDGTVMVQNGGGNAWYRLKPDARGSYVNGTWTTLASMHDTRQYYSSQVLMDGRVFVAGGEYGSGGSTAEVYDPKTNTWTMTPDSGQNFLDSISEILPNGNVIAAPVYGPDSTVIYNPNTNTWSAGPAALEGMDEVPWLKLPDNSVLCIGGQTSERYIPSLNQWVADANIPVVMYEGGETGCGHMLANGKAFFRGYTHTAIYTPSGNNNPGTWVAGPDVPGGLNCGDAPGAVMVNGVVLFVAGPDYLTGPTSFFEYDPVANSITQINGPTGLTSDTVPYGVKMLALPDGSILANVGGSLYEYTPSGSALAAGKPAISSISHNSDGSYHLAGTLLNGISEGAAYGDDFQMATNYPIVRMTDGSGNVYFARTYSWSSTGVQTGATAETTEFSLPLGLPAGTYSVAVVTNGIASAAVSLTTPYVTGDATPTVATAAAASPSIVNGTTTNLSVLGADSDGGGASNLIYTWAVSAAPTGVSTPSFSVNGTNAAKNTTATFHQNGAYTFAVTITDSSGLSVSSSVSVTVNQTLTSIAVSPNVVSLTSGQTRQLSATAYDQFGVAMASQPTFTWAVTSGSGTVSAGGLYTSPSSGTVATVTATSGAVQGSGTVYVVTAPWISADVGSPAIAGSASDSNGTFTVNGQGSDIWGTSDQFHYVYRTMGGDGMIVARVATQQNTAGWAKAGVMIRETTAANSAHAMMVLTPSNGTAFQWRASTGGSSSNSNTGGFVAPYWVKIVRSGNTFTGYRSSNGTTWTQQGSATIAMAGSVDIGMVVDSASGVLDQTTFDQVSLMVAGPDSLAVNPGGPGTVNVLANDVGPSGATLTVTAVTQGTKGTVVNNGNGTVTYTAGSNATGTDSFGYTVSDGLGDTATGTVNVSIGGLFREVWNNVGGGSVANLTSDPRYPNAPDVSEVVSTAETPQSYGDNYGQRLRGWIKPPTTGNYKFFISSDDASELWLSTNDSAGSKVKIAQVTGWTGYRAYSSGGQSALIPLTAGLRYYVEILHKEGGGGDHLSVAWQKPGDAVPADGSAPIDGQYLQSFSANNAPAFTSNPVSKPAATAGSSYTASLAGDASDPDASDTLTFSKVSGPAWLNIAANGALSGTPASGDVGGNSWTVRVTDSGGLAASATLNISVNSSGSLPPGWTGGDIGSVGVAGSASASGGTYTVSGSGSDIWGTADGFQFVSQDLVGNGEIRARVTSQTNSDPWAKAGVMIRDGTSAGAAHAMMVITPGNGFAFQYRSAADGASATVAGPALNGAPNNWVRVTRSGTLLTTYVSANGATWTQVGTATISMSATVKAGLAVTSHNNSVLSTATFDNVVVTTFPAPWQTVDIGTTGLQGSAEYYNAAYTVKGAGNISGTADNFRYVYQTLSGDGEIKVRIQAPGNIGTSARLGVMIRDALTSGSAYAFMGVDGGGAYYWQRRSSTGANTASIASGSGTAPNFWVRVVRAGNALTGYKSSDGVNWTQVSSRNITMGTNIYVGMVDASGSTSTLNTTVFDNVTVVP